MKNRFKLLLLAVAFIAIVALGVGTQLARNIRQPLMREAQVELARNAKVVGALLERLPELTPAEIDAVADRVGGITGARITIADDQGRTLGDSTLAVTELSVQGAGPTGSELADALREGTGTSVLIGGAGESDIFFVTVRVPGPKGDGPLLSRASRSMSSIDQVVGQSWWAVFWGACASTTLATALLWWPTQERAASVTADETGPPEDDASPPDVLPAPETEERSLLSLQRMADDLETTLQTLSAERNRFEAVLQTMDQAVLATDAEQRVTTVNRAARNLLSIAAGAEGRTLVEAVRVPGLIRLAEDATDTEPRSAEFDIAGGRRVEARATGLAEGGVVLVLLDVTEIRRLERVRRDFVANVSHELRTPISVIKANAETLLDGALEDEEHRLAFVEAVLRHADRLGRIVADLLDISRIEAGRYPLNISRPLVADIVSQVFESVAVDAAHKGTNITASIPPGLAVRADRKALEHILINLVTNAVKYSGEKGHVEVVAVSGPDSVRIEVRDDGPGIDPKHRARIFERFYRADPGRSRDMGGTGLGLSIVKHLVEAMDGEVGLKPRSPHGSVFWVALRDSDDHRTD